MIEDTITAAEATRFYDRYGARLDWSDRFEGRAKALAHGWLELAPGQTVLELGPGTGRFQALATAAVGPTGTSIAVDLSLTMLRLTRARAPAARAVRASALALPLPDGACDRAFSSYVLDLLPRGAIATALAELRRVLRPGGQLVLCSLGEGSTRVERLLMGLWSRIHRLAPARVGGCRPLGLEPLVAAAGFEVERRAHVGQLGVPSEVLGLRRPA